MPLMPGSRPTNEPDRQCEQHRRQDGGVKDLPTGREESIKHVFLGTREILRIFLLQHFVDVFDLVRRQRFQDLFDGLIERLRRLVAQGPLALVSLGQHRRIGQNLLPDLLQIFQPVWRHAGRRHHHAAVVFDRQPEVHVPLAIGRELELLVDGRNVRLERRAGVADGSNHLGLAALGVFVAGAVGDGKRVDFAIHHREAGFLAAFVADDDLAIQFQRFAENGGIVAEIVDAADRGEFDLLAGWPEFP